jgi:glycosyltransferase involved in cell wall biosynthesis
LNEPLRVLHVQTDTGLSGGVASYISTLVTSPALAGVRQSVVVPGARADAPRCRALYGDAAVFELPPSYGRLGLFAYARALQAIVRRERIDVLHAHAMRPALAAAIVARRCGVALAYTNHGLRFTQKGGALARAVFRRLEAFVCARAAAVVAIRPFDAGVLRREALVPGARLHVIETRIDAPVAAGITRTQDAPTVIGVGSLLPLKRPDRFVDWLAALAARGVAVRARWAGDGTLRAGLEARVRRDGLPLQFMGQLDRAGLAALYGGASLLWLTSDFEVFPLVVLEAAANGVPVVSARFDGIEDIVEPGVTGVLVDADDPGAVAAEIAALLADEPRRRALGDAARARFHARFADPDAMASRYATLYGDIAPRR